MSTAIKRYGEADTLRVESPVAVACRGKPGRERWLICRRDDMEAGETNGPSQLYMADTGDFSTPRPLQEWFKFGQWPAAAPGTPLPFDAVAMSAKDA